jgi:hypothetical protein
MTNKMQQTSQAVEDHQACDHEKATHLENVLMFKKRMLQWPNPVEYVNNMYGCHPDDEDNEYFKVIFAK